MKVAVAVLIGGLGLKNGKDGVAVTEMRASIWSRLLEKQCKSSGGCVLCEKPVSYQSGGVRKTV